MTTPSRLGSSARKSAIGKIAAIVLTAIIFGSVVGGAVSYVYVSRVDSTIADLRADVKSIADASGVPIGDSEGMKKLIDERKVLEGAKKEGKVTFYSTGDSRLDKTLISRFESRYPFITVERVGGQTGWVGPRFIPKSVDTIQMNSVDLGLFEESGVPLAKYVPKYSGYVPSNLKGNDGKWTAVGPVIWTIAYNTKLVSKDDAPKSFRDLVDPKWKSKLGAGDPLIPLYVNIFKTLEKEYGGEYIKNLLSQNISYYPGYIPKLTSHDKLAKGEFPILITAISSFIEQSKNAGQPVDWVRTSDNTYLSSFDWLGIAENSPNPNAARLFVDFTFSKEGQQIRADAGSPTFMPELRLSNRDMALENKRLVSIETLLPKDLGPVEVPKAIENQLIFKTTNGQQISLAELQKDGKPLVIYFFATWCPLCDNNLRNLNATYQKYKDKVNVLVVQFDPSETQAQVRKYKESKNYEWPFAYYNKDAILTFKIVTQSTKIVLDSNGKLVFSQGFVEASEKDWESILQSVVQ